jgi:hypothetical protein
MANIQEQDAWTAVYRLEQTDPALGGADDSKANLPHKHLVDRTAYLRSFATRTIVQDMMTAGPDGQQWDHAVGSGLYSVAITPLVNPQGQLGEVWVTKNAAWLKVHNSGQAGILVEVQLTIKDTDIPA